MVDSVANTASAALAHTLTPVELFLQADAIVKTVIILLIIASAWGWAVIAEKIIRLRILHGRAAKLVDSIQGGLPVAYVAESFAAAPPNDPLVQVYNAMVDENVRSADLIYTEAQRTRCKIASTASLSSRVRARLIICNRACRASRPLAPSRPSSACSGPSGAS